MTINELLDKPVWQMTGEELLFLAQYSNMSTIYPRTGNQQRLLPPKKKSDMCMGWLALYASSAVVCLQLTVSSRVVKSIVPLHKYHSSRLINRTGERYIQSNNPHINHRLQILSVRTIELIIIKHCYEIFPIELRNSKPYGPVP